MKPPGLHGRVAARSHTATARIRDQIHAVRRLRSLSASTPRALYAQTSNGEERVRHNLARSPVRGDTIARDLARSRLKRSQPIIRSKRSVYEDVCSTLNRLKTPRWADTVRVDSAQHGAGRLVSHAAQPGRSRARTVRRPGLRS